MKLEVGMCVRTIYGIKRITDIICGQDIRFDNTDGFDEDLLNYHDYDGISKNSHTWEEIVIGEPKGNIIELIEVGDYVNGFPVIHKENDILKCGLLVQFKENEIKSIVTKEQFEIMSYKIN